MPPVGRASDHGAAGVVQVWLVNCQAGAWPFGGFAGDAWPVSWLVPRRRPARSRPLPIRLRRFSAAVRYLSQVLLRGAAGGC
jgi:hypothetical protein